MPPRWTLRKYRQISFFIEAGENFDIDPQKYSSNEIYATDIDQRLHNGVIYSDKKKKYWVDLKEQDCFAIYARALIITNGDDPNYWRWTTDSLVMYEWHRIKINIKKIKEAISREFLRENLKKETIARDENLFQDGWLGLFLASSSGDGVEMATVKKTKWLEVKGSFWTTNLSAGVEYEVSFRTRMEEKEKVERPDIGDMNTKEVNLRLIPPSGQNQEGQATLPGSKSGNDPWCELIPRDQRFRFTMEAKNVGKMDFVMEASFKSWRAGLVIKGVEIKPVDDEKNRQQQ